MGTYGRQMLLADTPTAVVPSWAIWLPAVIGALSAIAGASLDRLFLQRHDRAKWQRDDRRQVYSSVLEHAKRMQEALEAALGSPTPADAARVVRVLDEFQSEALAALFLSGSEELTDALSDFLDGWQDFDPDKPHEFDKPSLMPLINTMRRDLGYPPIED